MANLLTRHRLRRGTYESGITRQGKIVVDTAEDLVPSAGEVLVKTLACGIGE